MSRKFWNISAYKKISGLVDLGVRPRVHGFRIGANPWS